MIDAFEEGRWQRLHPVGSKGEIEVVCEECGLSTVFPGSLNGTTQECLHCHAYVDVGDLPWDEDVGTPDE